MRKIEKSGLFLFLIILIVFSVSPSQATDSIKNNRNRHPEIRPLGRFPNGGILSMTFRSNIDDSIQPLLVKVPKGYTPEESWPLLVTLHGLGDGPILTPGIEAMAQIGPYGRGSVWYEGIGGQDVFECIEMAKQLLSIDEDRVYLCGFSMGGLGTFELGLKYPHVWAACVPVCGRCNSFDLIENAMYLPFWINTGSKDIMVPSEYSRAAYDRARQLDFSHWKYTEHGDMGHDFSINWKEVEEWLLPRERTKSPGRVSFRTKDIRFNRAYWLEITEIEHYGKLARIDALIDGQRIEIETKNVANYTIRLDDTLLDIDQSIRILENNIEIHNGRLSEDGCFIRARLDENTVIKRSDLSGPLWDIYSNPCLLIYGTYSKDRPLIRASKRCAESFRSPPWMGRMNFRVITDKEASERDLTENNIVLFGNAETNKILASVTDKLPIRMEAGKVVVRNMKYSGDNIGYVLIYPNPLNQKKYIAVLAGNSATTIDCFERIWPRFDAVPRVADFGVFGIDPSNDSVTWHVKDIFGTNWDFRR
jgi:pimeloyl-ACP methyl ester carboxylesterase